jgi:hypothetical protein
VHTDDRGRLLVVEHRDLDYVPARVFVVTGARAGTSRGDHIVPCRQTMVLVSGGVTVTLRGAERDDARIERLIEPGDLLEMLPGEYVSYALDDPASTIMVFAEAPYQEHAP